MKYYIKYEKFVIKLHFGIINRYERIATIEKIIRKFLNFVLWTLTLIIKQKYDVVILFTPIPIAVEIIMIR